MKKVHQISKSKILLEKKPTSGQFSNLIKDKKDK